MAQRMRGLAPLAISVAVIAIAYCEIAFNFSFHWATNGDLGNGLSLPASFHFAVPAAFVAWALFFVVGGDDAAAAKVAIGSVFGCLAGLALFALVAGIQQAPDFLAISVGVGVLGGVLVLLGALGDWYVIPTAFAGFACCVFWWAVTGLDGWAPGGGGAANTVAALAKPETAGTGAFGGVLSTPYPWVAIDVAVTLLVGVACGMLSTRLAAVLTPRARVAPSPSALADEGVAPAS